METIATRQNNPGNIKDTSTGQFKTYSTPQEGYAALLNDLETKKSGKSQTGLKPDSTLADFSKAYAPESDKNNPAQYTANLANHMGVRPDAKISELDTGKWAEAIANAEGYKGQSNTSTTTPSSTRKSFTEQLATQPASITPETNPTSSGNFISNLGQGHFKDAAISGVKDLGKGIVGLGNTVTFGGAKQLGEEAGKGAAILKENIKGLFGGENNSKYIEQPSFEKTVKGAAKTVAGAGLLAGPEILGGIFKGKSALANPEVVKILQQAVNPGEKLSALSRQGAIERLTAHLDRLPLSKVGSNTEKLILKALEELKPTVAEKAKLSGKVLKLLGGAVKTAIGGTILGGAINKGEKIAGMFK